jgi:pimeloyl-ACP methyl ester carboxylesterase
MDVQDIIEALGEGAHLVGHSYGGAMSLLAAARRPDLVRSLAVIEPPVFGVVRGNPDVERILARLIPLFNSAGTLTPEEFFQGFRGALSGKPPATSHVELTPLDVKGIQATMLERPSWEVDVPLHELASAPFPRSVFSGNWSSAFDAVCDVLEQQAGFKRVVVEGGGHAVSLAGEPFTRCLVDFLESVKQ